MAGMNSRRPPPVTTAFVTTSPAANRIPAATPCAAAGPRKRGPTRIASAASPPDAASQPKIPSQTPSSPWPVAPASEMPRKARPTAATATPKSSRRVSRTPARRELRKARMPIPPAASDCTRARGASVSAPTKQRKPPDSAAKPVIQPRLRSSIASDRRGLRTESGGRAEAASCSRIQAQLIARAETNVSRIANVNECMTSLRAHRYMRRGGPDRGGPDRVRPMGLLDTSTEFGQRAERRLHKEKLAWLTAVDAKGTPQPIPVWFLWDGADSVLIYSRPDTPKLRAIERNPRVSLNLDGNGSGGDIVVATGDASVSDDPPAHELPDYVEKYASLIERNRWTPESFAADYSVPIRITIGRVRGH